MNKHEAIAWYKQITGGGGIDRTVMPAAVRLGNVAQHFWHDSTFSYGMEYGILWALAIAFDITREDLYSEEAIKYDE